MARKEQEFDWDRRYHKSMWEKMKKIQKFLRQNPTVKKFITDTVSGQLYIKGKSLGDLHKIRTTLRENSNWADKINNKIAFENNLSVYYQGLDAYNFVIILIEFPYTDLPEGILGDCYIKTTNEKIEAYTCVQKSIVCPMRGK